jgi:hypothetical protein
MSITALRLSRKSGIAVIVIPFLALLCSACEGQRKPNVELQGASVSAV